MIIFDGDGMISLANAQACALFGYDAEELEGLPVEDLIPTPASAPCPWYEMPGASASGGESGGESGCEPGRALGRSPGSEDRGELSRVREMELLARRRDGDEFPAEISLAPLALVAGAPVMSAAIRDITDRKLAAEALTRQAHHDALTGLPNRLLFLERLEQALTRACRSGRPLAVVFLDLDDFKLVNDTQGHDHGDLLLKKLAPRLVGAVRGGDTVARLGGDEFVALCESLSEDADAMALGQRLTDAIAAPVRIREVAHKVSVSTGVMLVRNPAEVTANGVLRDADAAMYNAKSAGKGRVAVFDGTVRAQILEQLAMESALRRAVPAGELRLDYQPVIELDSGRVVAAEALVRWQHPKRGLLLPGAFLARAERAGLLGPIGEWVITQACRQAAAWRDRFPALRIPVSVNVAGAQLRRGGLAAHVERVLRETGLDAGLLEIEVTESVLHERDDSAARELRALRALGTKLVIDDFGAGYSSLVALGEWGIDTFKLDRSFAAGLGRACAPVTGEEGCDRCAATCEEGAMVKAVLALAAAIDARVVAEGVETESQLALLRSQGCAIAQGYLPAAPASAGEITALIAGTANVTPALAA